MSTYMPATIQPGSIKPHEEIHMATLKYSNHESNMLQFTVSEQVSQHF